MKTITGQYSMNRLFKIIFLIFTATSFAQERTLNYTVNHKNNVIKNVQVSPFESKLDLDNYSATNSYSNAERGQIATVLNTQKLYIWNGTIWQETDDISDAWRDETGTTKANSYTETITHNGSVIITKGNAQFKLENDKIIVVFENSNFVIDSTGVTINDKYFFSN
jgi:flagella basal body P-ring formation protein FlgA